MPVPVAFTVFELAQQNIVEVLSSVSTHNGYLTDLDVFVVQQGGKSPLTDGLAQVGFGRPTPSDRGEPCLFEGYLMKVTIGVTFIESEPHDPAVIRSRMNNAAGDIRRALLMDRGRGVARAVNTEFNDADEFHVQGSPSLLIVEPTIWLRHRVGNPYQRF